MIRTLFNFFLFTSLYISCCALLMVWQTNQLLQLHYAEDTYYAFVFAATMCSYNFHWYLTPSVYSDSERITWAQQHKTLQLSLCGISGLAALYFFWPMRTHWLPLSGAAVLTFLYTAPKIPFRTFTWLSKIAIGKTLFLTFVWTYVTTLLPAFMADAPITTDVLLFTAHRFFLIYAICILFDYRDLESDKKEGIRSLITYLSFKNLFRVYYLSLLLAAICACLLLPYTYPPVIITLLIPVLATALVTNKARYAPTDYLFYFVLDGLMMLSAMLHLLMSGEL
jgi:1,4-dihydroxy-2-naphthoate octaprenyltransferase